MTYHRAMGMLPAPIPTAAYTQSIDPYAMRSGPPGGTYAPYGWGPGTFIGMPMNYSHHLGYETSPVRPGVYRRAPSSGLGVVVDALTRAWNRTRRPPLRPGTYDRLSGLGAVFAVV